jgi:phosphoribosylformimino-5-aminoimidazole carboxamide ribotide isomerase
MTDEIDARPFEVIPAIDLRGTRVVRLERGEFDRETAFSDDPVAVARGFTRAGARWLHVVDLDGARDGRPAQLETVGAIVIGVGGAAAVEAAGGIRSAEAVTAAFAAGADRVVLGTAALRDPRLVRAAIREHGQDAVAVAVDVRAGQAVGEGWRAGAAGSAPDDLMRRLAGFGVAWFEVTAIDRDGLLGGPDLRLLERLVGIGVGPVVASGGIRDVADLAAARDLGCAGAIVGRALYDGSLDLGTAIATLAAGR